MCTRSHSQLSSCCKRSLDLCGWRTSMPLSFLASCKQLRMLELWGVDLTGPGSLVASTILQDLAIANCSLSAAEGVAGGPVSWQQILSCPGRLPHLTSLALSREEPDLQLVDVEYVVACCSSLQVLHLTTLQDSFASALVQLSGLTELRHDEASDEQCGALAQLTGLRELTVQEPNWMSAAGPRQLAALEQLTSLGFDSSFGPSKASSVLQAQMPDRLLHCSRALVNQAPAGQPSDVSARLLWACDMAAAADGS